MHAPTGAPDPAAAPSASSEQIEYTRLHFTKADLEDSLSTMFDKLAHKFQAELYKSTSTLTQEIAALGGWTDMLETNHDRLHLAYVDQHKEHETLSDTVLQLQTHLEDLDNCNRRNNIRVCGVSKMVVALPSAVKKIFHSFLTGHADTYFTCNRMHRALQPKLTPENPQETL